MKNTLIFVPTIILLFLFFTACEKNNENVTGVVELYLLEVYETVGETPEIDLATVILAPEPLLGYPDFKSYNAKEYYVKVTDDARETIEEMDHSVAGVPFAVTADEEVVYTGYFVPAYSSISMQWIVIDPVFWRLNNRMYVALGYPGQFEGSVIPDHRNDPRILDIFRRDGNLVE